VLRTKGKLKSDNFNLTTIFKPNKKKSNRVNKSNACSKYAKWLLTTLLLWQIDNSLT